MSCYFKANQTLICFSQRKSQCQISDQLWWSPHQSSDTAHDLFILARHNWPSWSIQDSYNVFKYMDLMISWIVIHIQPSHSYISPILITFKCSHNVNPCCKHANWKCRAHVFSKDATISYIIFYHNWCFPTYATQKKCKMLIQGRIWYRQIKMSTRMIIFKESFKKMYISHNHKYVNYLEFKQTYSCRNL